jgi:hypothetical protein
MDLLAAAVFLALHNVDGDEIVVNTEQIVTLYPTHEVTEGKPNSLMAGGLKCVIALTDGKRVSVVENCATIRQSIQQHEGRP